MILIRLCILNSLYDAEKEKKKKTSRIVDAEIGKQYLSNP